MLKMERNFSQILSGSSITKNEMPFEMKHYRECELSIKA